MTTIKSLLESLDRPMLRVLGDSLNLTLSGRAPLKFMINKIYDVLFDPEFSWVYNLPYSDLLMIRDLIDFGANSEQTAKPLICPHSPQICVALLLVNFAAVDDDPDYLKYWLPKDLYDYLADDIDDILQEYSETPYSLVDTTFWGMIYNYGVITKDELIDHICDVYEEEEDLDEMLQYIEEYIPVRFLQDSFGDIINPLMDEDDIDCYDSILNEEMEDHPQYSPDKVFVDGVRYPYGFASPVFYDPHMDEQELDPVPYHDLFVNDDTYMSFLTFLYIILQRQDSFTEKDVNVMVDRILNIDNSDLLSESCTREEFRDALRDIILNIPILKLRGYTLGFVKDIKLEFDDFDDFDEDEFDESFIERPSSDVLPFLKKVGPYDICPCGSGLLYMHCHGKMTLS